MTLGSHAGLSRVAVSGAREGAVGSGDDAVRLRMAGQRSVFDVTVEGGEGLAWRAPVAKAVSVVGGVWRSKVDVRTRVRFEEIGGEDVLARGGGTQMVRFGKGDEGLVPVAVAEAVGGKDVNGGMKGDDGWDVLVTVNKGAKWYFGTDGSPKESEYDLVTVLLHEVYHSLMFAGAVVVDGGVGGSGHLRLGMTARFDTFLSDADGCRVTGYLDASDSSVKALITATKMSAGELFAAGLTSQALYFAGYMEKEGAVRRVARLSAPKEFVPKSSVYHLDISETSDALMVPSVKRGTAVHAVGPKVRAIQNVFLDSSVRGAVDCRGRMKDPLKVAAAARASGVATKSTTSFESDALKAEATNTPAPAAPVVETTLAPTTKKSSESDTAGAAVSNKQDDDGGSKVAGLAVWAFVLVVLFSVIAVAILLALCAMLCVSCIRKKPVWKSYTFTSSRTGTTKSHRTHTHTNISGSGPVISVSEDAGIIADDHHTTTEYGGPIGGGVIASSTKKTSCKKSSTKPSTTISKSRSHGHHCHKHRCHAHRCKPHQHHGHHGGHHHHGHRHQRKRCKYQYSCHCCKCKGRNAITVSGTSSSSGSSSAPPPPSTMRSGKKCCPCRNCKSGSTIQIRVVGG